jgi:hypothetical protein
MTLLPFPSVFHTALDFDRWLRAAIQSQIVGTTQSGDCPLSRWLKNIHRTQDVAVTDSAIWIDGVGYEIPSWAADFKGKVDERGKTVTARQALTMLGSVGEGRRAA